MAPLREYICDYCGHLWEALVYGTSPEDYATAECRCGSQGKVLPSVNAQPRGSFGTVGRKLGKQNHTRFNGTVDEPVQKEVSDDKG